MGARSVHPFPARMAPELALQKIDRLSSPGDSVLDPMCGSGTVPRLASAAGRRAIGTDLDPLAVMMTRAACSTASPEGLAQRAEQIIEVAHDVNPALPDWITADEDSVRFVEYWFAPRQRSQLSQLAKALSKLPSGGDTLRIALSRIIVTKDGGASLARDTSHSRPHRVRDTNDLDVFTSFVDSARRLEKILTDSPRPQQRPRIRTVDARRLSFVERGSVDLVVTSPPYLNAIDYLRGHRMSLIWLGWDMSTLRDLRGESIGSERSLRNPKPSILTLVENAVPRVGDLDARRQRMVFRFARDMDQLSRSLERVTKPSGHVVFVVANSHLRGVEVSNAELCASSAQARGFELISTERRPLPARHRYLPPPSSTTGSLGSRMNEEVILTLRRAA